MSLAQGLILLKKWLSLCLKGCVRFARYCGKMSVQPPSFFLRWIAELGKKGYKVTVTESLAEVERGNSGREETE